MRKPKPVSAFSCVPACTPPLLPAALRMPQRLVTNAQPGAYIVIPTFG